MGRYVQSVMRGAIAKSYEASRAAARVAAFNAGEYALRRVQGGSIVNSGGVVLGTADNQDPRGRSGMGNEGGCGFVRVDDNDDIPHKTMVLHGRWWAGGPVIIPHAGGSSGGCNGPPVPLLPRCGAVPPAPPPRWADSDNGDHGAPAAAHGNAGDGNPLRNDDAATAAVAGKADDAGQENNDRGGDDGDNDKNDNKWGRGA